MTSDLEGKVVVVTGATGGLGPAVVEVLLAAGATCFVPHRGKAAPDDLAVAARGAADRLQPIGGVDLTSEAAVSGFYGALPSLWASVHVAGGFAPGPLLNTTLADLRGQLDINLTTAFLCCREAVRKMGAAGGRIVNVAARAALEPKGGSIAYSVAKAGVAMLTQSLADEVKTNGILVNAVAPSTIDTAANRRAMPDAPHHLWPKPAQLAAAILWLCSPDNQLTTGALVPVYGRG